MTIRILITGGTIDEEFDPKLANFIYHKTHIKQMLREARDLAKVKLSKLMLKDSRDITDKDRQLILKKCKTAEEKQIIITHGTYTMEQTAKLLGKSIKNKTIILTGSLIPGGVEKTDALFNLGSAIIAAQILPKGVYVVIQGEVFKWNNVRKNVKKARFETLR